MDKKELKPRLSPAQRHRQEILAKIEAEKAAEAGRSGYGEMSGDEYDQMRALLTEHERALKKIQSAEAKGAYKLEILEAFAPWLSGVLEADMGVQDEVLVRCMIWYLDAGLYDEAMPLFAYAIKHNLKAPDGFNRTIPVILMDEMVNVVEAGKVEAIPAMLFLEEVMELTAGHDAPDELTARLLRRHAYALLGVTGKAAYDLTKVKPEYAKSALREVRRALELDTKVGVVKDIERLESHLKKVAPKLLEELETEKATPAPEGAQATGGEGGNTDQPPTDGLNTPSQPLSLIKSLFRSKK